MRISDWSSDVCSPDLLHTRHDRHRPRHADARLVRLRAGNPPAAVRQYLPLHRLSRHRNGHRRYPQRDLAMTHTPPKYTGIVGVSTEESRVGNACKYVYISEVTD